LLKIAVLTAHFPSLERPTHGRSAYDTLRLLALDAEVEVFYPRATYPWFLKARNDFKEEIQEPFEAPGINVRYIDYPAVPVLSRPFNGRVAARALLPHVRRFAPDVILGYFLYPDCYAALLIGRALGVPVFAKAVGSDLHSVTGALHRRLTKRVLQQANGVLTVSRDLRDVAIRMGAPTNQVVANANGCDTNRFCVQDRSAARRRHSVTQTEEAVVYIGRLDQKKGLRELIGAAVMLHVRRPEMRLYLVGHGPDRPILEQDIRSNHAESYIHLPGACTPSDVPTWISASNLIALPSYAEGCPNIILEALACGRPVVATHVGGIPEIMDEQCGRLVLPRQTVELATAISSVLDREWEPHALSARQTRTWENTADEMLRVISGKLENAKPGGDSGHGNIPAEKGQKRDVDSRLLTYSLRV
jgi:glycosyltransferase involved in cell wall biosynthesis